MFLASLRAVNSPWKVSPIGGPQKGRLKIESFTHRSVFDLFLSRAKVSFLRGFLRLSCMDTLPRHPQYKSGAPPCTVHRRATCVTQGYTALMKRPVKKKQKKYTARNKKRNRPSTPQKKTRCVFHDFSRPPPPLFLPPPLTSRHRLQGNSAVCVFPYLFVHCRLAPSGCFEVAVCRVPRRGVRPVATFAARFFRPAAQLADHPSTPLCILLSVASLCLLCVFASPPHFVTLPPFILFYSKGVTSPPPQKKTRALPRSNILPHFLGLNSLYFFGG